MNRNIAAIKAACEIAGFPCKSPHSTGNLLAVEIAGNSHLFVNWATPLNPQSIMQLCQDKDYFYSFYKDVVAMPSTLSFLNPHSDEQYEIYLRQKTVYAIVEAIERNFRYPLIVKKNRGSWGRNVFKVCSRRELEKGIIEIFNMNSASFDYVCVAQACIDIDTEYRVVFLNGDYQFSYKKVVENARFNGNLSPLHWDGAIAEMVDDEKLIEEFEAFCRPLFNKLVIPYCGLDIAVDKSGAFWLIEANSSPGYDRIIEHGGKDEVVRMYRNMLELLATDNSMPSLRRTTHITAD